jgi:hypothetical protein
MSGGAGAVLGNIKVMSIGTTSVKVEVDGQPQEMQVFGPSALSAASGMPGAMPGGARGRGRGPIKLPPGVQLPPGINLPPGLQIEIGN